MLDVSARLGRRSRFWVYVEGALTTRPEEDVRGFAVTLRDLPVAAGARVRLMMAHGSLAIGPRASFHVFDVTASAPDGRAASSRRYTFGLGGLGVAELSLPYHAHAFVAATAEGLVPSQDFTIAGQPALGTGGFLYGATIGLGVALP